MLLGSIPTPVSYPTHFAPETIGSGQHFTVYIVLFICLYLRIEYNPNVFLSDGAGAGVGGGRRAQAVRI